MYRLEDKRLRRPGRRLGATLTLFFQRKGEYDDWRKFQVWQRHMEHTGWTAPTRMLDKGWRDADEAGVLESGEELLESGEEFFSDDDDEL
jgi:hypothetical protein